MAIALSGSLILSGSITVSGSIISTGTISMSGSIASASYASNADTLDGLDSTVFTLTSSFTAQTASFTAFTSSVNSFSASILAQTSSLNAFSASVLTYTSSINNKTSSFATTGSNTFIGTQVVSGSILQSGSFTSTGTLTAQTLVIQTITSSVVYSSGSNIFGNDVANSQTFTGSVLITGSLSVNGTSSIVGTGTTNYLPKFTAASIIGNSNLINDASGNLGLGVTPSAWGSGSTAFQIGNGAIWKSGSRSVDWIANGYYDGTNYIYNLTNAATFYRQYDGQHQWYQAPSGTAGNAITFTQAMTLDASGRLGIGINAPDVKLDVVGTNRIQLRTDDTIPEIRSITPNGSAFKEFGLNGLELRFYISSTERMRIWTSTGNVNIGTTPASDSGYKLDVNGTGRFSGVTYFTGGNIQVSNSNASLYSVTTYENTGTSGKSFDIGVGGSTSAQPNRFYIYDNGANALRFYIDSTGAATFSSSVAATTADGANVGLRVIGGTGRFVIFPYYDATNGVLINSYNTAESGYKPMSFQASAFYFSQGATTFSGDFTAYGTFGSFGQLHIAGATDSNKKLVFGYNTSANVGFIQAMQNGTSYSPLLLNSTAGNVLIGTTSDNSLALLQVNGAIYSSGSIYQGTASNGGTGQGGVALNTTNIDIGHPNGTASGDNYTRYIYNGNVIGSISQNGTTGVLYNTTSDYRLKEDYNQINGLQKLSAIKVYNYKWKGTEQRMDGVIAHELQEVIPYAVTGEKDGEEMQGVDYSKLVPILVKAIQELEARVQYLENK